MLSMFESARRTAAAAPCWMLLSVILVAWPVPLAAQMPDDGRLLSRGALMTGVMYSRDSWEAYWEGDLKRSNGNIGTLTTQSITWLAGYGLNERMSLTAMLPYVWTAATQGTSRGLGGLQDLALVAKVRLLTTPFTELGTLRAVLVGGVSTPVTDYTPDYLPFSIGLASRQFSGRFTLHFQARGGWFATGSSAYTWRSNVRLDRPSYFTDGQLFLTDEVAMPSVVDYTVSAGLEQGRLELPVAFTRQITLGGGDIRRQDMPFVSNRMNLTRVEASAMYRLPVPARLTARLGVSRVLSGRNVGESTTIKGGLMYLVRP